MPARIERLSAGVGRRHPAHNSQAVVDDRVNGAGMRTATPYRSAVLCC